MNKLKRIEALVICVVPIFILSLGYYNVKLRDVIEISVRLINNSNSSINQIIICL